MASKIYTVTVATGSSYGGGTGNVVPQPKAARKKLSNYLKIQKKK